MSPDAIEASCKTFEAPYLPKADNEDSATSP